MDQNKLSLRERLLGQLTRPSTEAPPASVPAGTSGSAPEPKGSAWPQILRSLFGVREKRPPPAITSADSTSYRGWTAITRAEPPVEMEEVYRITSKGLTTVTVRKPPDEPREEAGIPFSPGAISTGNALDALRAQVEQDRMNPPPGRRGF